MPVKKPVIIIQALDARLVLQFKDDRHAGDLIVEAKDRDAMGETVWRTEQTYSAGNHALLISGLFELLTRQETLIRRWQMSAKGLGDNKTAIVSEFMQEAADALAKIALEKP